MPNYYKLLLPDGRTPQGYGTWPLPAGGQPGPWLPRLQGKLVRCEHGYHVMRATDIRQWLTEGCQLYRVDVKYKPIDGGDKVVVRQARAAAVVPTWSDSLLRTYAADCVERVLPIYEKEYPDDMRPRNAITMARAYAAGDCTSEAAIAAAEWAMNAGRQYRRTAVTAAANTAAFAAANAAYCDYPAAVRCAVNAVSLNADDSDYVSVKRAELQWQADHLVTLLGIG